MTLEFYLSILGMQLKFCLDQLQKLAEDKLQSSVTLENTQRRLSDVRRQSQQVRDTVVEMQSKIGSNRVTCMELQVELEKERYLVCNNVYKIFLRMIWYTEVVNLFVFLYLGLPRKEWKRIWRSLGESLRALKSRMRALQ